MSHYGPEERRLSFSRSLLVIGLLLGAFQVSVLAITGLFTVFGNSPYARSFPGVLYNLIFWGSALVAIEFTRAYLMKLVGLRFLTLSLIGLALILAFIDLPWVRYTTLGGIIDTIPFLGGILVPLAGEHILAAFIVVEGGPAASIAYRGVMEAFEWYMPILPDPPWILKGFVGVIVSYHGSHGAAGLHCPQYYTSSGGGRSL